MSAGGEVVYEPDNITIMGWRILAKQANGDEPEVPSSIASYAYVKRLADSTLADEDSRRADGLSDPDEDTNSTSSEGSSSDSEASIVQSPRRKRAKLSKKATKKKTHRGRKSSRGGRKKVCNMYNAF
jgi:hypothetical protein